MLKGCNNCYYLLEAMLSFHKFVKTILVGINTLILGPSFPEFNNVISPIRSPLPLSVDVPYVDGYPSLANPKLLDVLIETPGLKSSNKEHYFSYLSFAPPEVMSCIVLFLKKKNITFEFLPQTVTCEMWTVVL
jgi:hypothetical protein